MSEIAVITEPCIAICDTACVDVCPVDCIHGPVSVEIIRSIPAEERAQRLDATQMFVDPAECIFCGACVPACPVNAIFMESEVPDEWRHYIEKNAAFYKT